MNIKYNVTKLRNNKIEDIKDFVSIEEPLEMNLKFKSNGNWQIENLSINCELIPKNFELLGRSWHASELLKNHGSTGRER